MPLSPFKEQKPTIDLDARMPDQEQRKSALKPPVAKVARVEPYPCVETKPQELASKFDVVVDGTGSGAGSVRKDAYNYAEIPVTKLDGTTSSSEGFLGSGGSGGQGSGGTGVGGDGGGGSQSPGKLDDDMAVLIAKMDAMNVNLNSQFASS